MENKNMTTCKACGKEIAKGLRNALTVVKTKETFL